MNQFCVKFLEVLYLMFLLLIHFSCFSNVKICVLGYIYISFVFLVTIILHMFEVTITFHLCFWLQLYFMCLRSQLHLIYVAGYNSFHMWFRLQLHLICDSGYNYISRIPIGATHIDIRQHGEWRYGMADKDDDNYLGRKGVLLVNICVILAQSFLEC